MTQDEKRIKIAEACGWTFNPPHYNDEPFSLNFKAEALLCWVRPGNMPHQTECPPDYFNDLNAMHEAEKVLIERGLMDGFDGYSNTLCGIMDNGNNVHASSQQRAEAFGLTLNLW